MAFSAPTITMTFILAASGAPVAAQTVSDRLSFGVGAVVAPEFQGSASYDVTPIPVVVLSYDLGVATVRTRGLSILADVVEGSTISAGPIVRYEFGRTPGDISNASVAALPGIDATWRQACSQNSGSQ